MADEFDKFWLVIPTGTRIGYLKEIFDSSEIPIERRILIRTVKGPEIEGALNIPAHDFFNIQSWWNKGIEVAKENGARYVAILNDDTKISRGQLRVLFDLMINDGTDLCHPNPKETGGWGHCFILRVDSTVRPDERFTWWCGDYDLSMQAKRAGGITVAPITILNLHSNELTSQDPKFNSIIKRDIVEFRKKYPFYTIRHEFLPRALRKIKRTSRIFN